MATQTSQRIGIWVIAVVMLVGTLAGFAAMILIPQNETTDAQTQQKAYEDYVAQMKKAQEERQKSLRPLDGYSAEAFDAKSVSELKTDVLKQGDGEVLDENSTLKINYFGWTADGKIFDSTNIDGKTTPNETLALNGVIEGWKKGLVGHKVGSTVKLTIPSSMAYGDTDTGMGQPTGPLVFIVEILGKK
jgi:FKBP-type peptidyl-prolyl cis-trans isomerase